MPQKFISCKLGLIYRHPYSILTKNQNGSLFSCALRKIHKIYKMSTQKLKKKKNVKLVLRK